MKKSKTKHAISEESIIDRLEELAFANSRNIDDENVPIKISESLKALKLLMEYKGMLTDKIAFEGELNTALLEQARKRAKRKE